MTDAPGPTDEAERIRLLEFQVEFLRRELAVVTKRYDDLRWSAAWTLAKPLKRAEDAFHALVRRARSMRLPARATKVIAGTSPVADGGLEGAIAARIAAKIKRPPAAS